MNLSLANGQALRGDLIKSVVLRSDAVPVPATLEAEIRADADTARLLAEGQTVTADDDAYWIVRAESASPRLTQGNRDLGAVHIIAILNACKAVAFTRQTPVVKENATLAQIYRACGATIKAVDADIPALRFACYKGGVPSFGIARLLQEEGGIVRWKNSQLRFFRLQDLFAQTPYMNLPNNASDDVQSGFSERHEVPFFYSTSPNGAFVYGNRTKSRTARYIPRMDERRLRNLTRCLVLRKIVKTTYNAQLAAGDLIGIANAKPLAVVTAVHCYQTNTDGSGANQYTRLWLHSLEE